MKAWANWKEQQEDAALTRHEDGVCGDIDAGCVHCKREWEERHITDMSGRKEEIFCTRCGSPLDDPPIYLELDQRTNTYTDQLVPKEYSQGGFPFGKVCKLAALREHRKVNEQYEQRCKEVAEKARAKMNELDAYLKAMEWLEGKK